MRRHAACGISVCERAESGAGGAREIEIERGALRKKKKKHKQEQKRTRHHLSHQSSFPSVIGHRALFVKKKKAVDKISGARWKFPQKRILGIFCKVTRMIAKNSISRLIGSDSHLTASDRV